MEISYASPSCGDLSATAKSSSPSSPMAAAARHVKVIPLQHPATTSAPSFAAIFKRWKPKVKQRSPNEWIGLFLPCYRWIRTYKWREYLQNDVVAGLTVGVMLVPQGMSYAKLAGLEPIYGLCT